MHGERAEVESTQDGMFLVHLRVTVVSKPFTPPIFLSYTLT